MPLKRLVLICLVLSATLLYSNDQVVLKPERLHALHPDIRGVFVGPDGKTWFEKVVVGEITKAEAKRTIAAAFLKPQGVLTGVKPILFEPKGRIWFSYNDGQELLGYDGKVWITYKIPFNSKVIGSVEPNLGHYNTVFKDTPFISCKNILLWVKDGVINHKLFEGLGHYGRFTFIPDHQKERLIISVGGSKGRQFLTYCDGKLETMALPATIGDDVNLVYPWKGNLLCFKDKGIVDDLRYDKFAVNKMVRALGAATFVERRKATAELNGFPPSAITLLEQEHLKTTDPEIAARLATVIDALEAKKKRGVQAVIGTIEIGVCQQTYIFPDGSLLMLVKNMTANGQNFKEGLIRLDPDLTEPQLLHSSQMQPGIQGAPPYGAHFVNKPKLGLWFGNFNGLKTDFLDFETGTITKTIPGWITGIGAEDHTGRVFIRPNRWGSRIICFSPDQPEKRTPIVPVATLSLSVDPLCGAVAETTGEFWIQGNSGKTHCFKDGNLKEHDELFGYWHIANARIRRPSDELLFPEERPIHPERDNVRQFLPKTIPKWPRFDGYFCTNNEAVVVKKRGPLSSFLAENKAILPKYRDVTTAFQVTKDGDLWVAGVKGPYLYNSKWKLVDQVGKGFQEYEHGPLHIYPGYEPNTVLFKLDHERKPLFLTRRDKHLAVLRGTESTFKSPPPPVSLGSRGLLLPCSGSTHTRFVAYDPKGNGSIFDRLGIPVGADDTGVAWLVGRRGELRIFRDGAVVKRLHIPISKANNASFTRLSPGRVLFGNGWEFYLINTQGDDAYSLAKARRFYLKGISGKFHSVRYAGGKYLAIRTYIPNTRKDTFYFVPVASFKNERGAL